MTLDELNALDQANAEQELLQCCGARRWAKEMAARRPFSDVRAAARDAANIWRSLDATDWLEAFAAHPRIGDSPRPGATDRAGETGRAGQAGGVGETRKAGGAGGTGGAGGAAQWAAREQAGMDTASDELRQRLAAANRAYEDRFGFTYIVCATGKTADEMLAIAERRLNNARDVELRTAAEEQRQITGIRLEKLLA